MIISTACSEIDRDNILDPKNTSSKRESILLLEAFINTNIKAPPYNYYALDAIDSLSVIYGSRFLVVEYHRTTAEYPDSLGEAGILESRLKETYRYYTTDYEGESRVQGVPDLFLNGAANRVQGASNTKNVVTRINPLASNILNDSEANFTIEANVDKTLSGTYRIARLGNKQSDNMKLSMVVTYNSGKTGKRTAMYMSALFQIDKIEAGSFIEGDFSKDDFETFDIDPERVERIVFILRDESFTNILYAVEKTL